MRLILKIAVSMSLLSFLPACSDKNDFTSNRSKEPEVQFGEEPEPEPAVSGDVLANKPDVSDMRISCADESIDLTTKFADKSKPIVLQVEKTCDKGFDKIDEKGTSLIDLVIVLDTTNSMQNEINIIKANLAAFSNRLASNGWDARFGLVEFKDEVELRTPTFETASALTERIAVIRAEGGGDAPEAGQKALEAAVRLLEGKLRKNAVPAILYISDAPAWGRNENDLSIDYIYQSMKASLTLGLKNLQFYTSVASYLPFGIDIPIFKTLDFEEEPIKEFDVESILDIFTGGSLEPAGNTPRAQIKALREGLALPGLDVDFPLQANALLEDIVVSIEKISVPLQVPCALDTLRFNGDIIAAEDGGQRWLIDTGLLSEKSDNLVIERSCGEFGYKLSTVKILNPAGNKLMDK